MTKNVGTRIATIVLVLGFCTGTAALSQQRRAMTVSDVLLNATVDQGTLSPDGQSAALVINRPRTEGADFNANVFIPQRGDLWILQAGGESLNITRGAIDKTTSWAPVWSPDSSQIAFISTRNRSCGVCVFVYDIKHGSTRQLTNRSVDLDADIFQPNFDHRWRRPRPIGWADSHHLLVAAVHEGAPTNMLLNAVNQLQEISDAWSKTAQAQEPSMSVIDAGRVITERDRKLGSLLVVEAETGASRTLADADISRVAISADGEHAAIMTDAETWLPSAQTLLDFDSWAGELAGGWNFREFMKHRLGVANLKRGDPIQWFTGIGVPVPQAYMPPLWLGETNCWLSQQKTAIEKPVALSN
jgi:WD40-like Beta Propeller Repeat